MSKEQGLMNSLGRVYQTVEFGPEAHRNILQGAEVLYKAVKSTMGPSGHNVIIDNGMTAPLITKDGVTVAKSINLKDKLPSIGAELLKEIAGKTNEVAGDGTSTSVVLGYEMMSQGIKMVATNRSSIGIKKGMEFATDKVIEWLKQKVIQVRNNEDIINVGTISANGDRKIGELLCQAINKVGQDGIITIEPAKSVETTLEVVEGMQIDSGYVSPFFVTNQEKLTCELSNPLILVTNKKISSLQEILPALELANQQNSNLLIIGDEIEGEVLHTLIVNKMKGVLFSCAVKAPSYGDNRSDILQDIALVTGATVFDASCAVALKNIELQHLGQCSKVVVGRNFTTFVGDGNTETKSLIDERVKVLRNVLSNDKTLDDLRKSNIKKRLAKLAGGIAVVKVGGSTELEILEKKDRVEDALNATVAAVQEGILPGGGTALFYAAEHLRNVLKANHDLTEDEVAGAMVVYETCKRPLKVIVENTGKSAEVVMNKLLEGPGTVFTAEDKREEEKIRFGYDAYRHKYCDLIDKGIIDPFKVEKNSLQFATSVVGLLLTCNAIVINQQTNEQ